VDLGSVNLQSCCFSYIITVDDLESCIIQSCMIHGVRNVPLGSLSTCRERASRWYSTLDLIASGIPDTVNTRLPHKAWLRLAQQQEPSSGAFAAHTNH